MQSLGNAHNGSTGVVIGGNEGPESEHQGRHIRDETQGLFLLSANPHVVFPPLNISCSPSASFRPKDLVPEFRQKLSSVSHKIKAAELNN